MPGAEAERLCKAGAMSAQRHAATHGRAISCANSGRTPVKSRSRYRNCANEPSRREHRTLPSAGKLGRRGVDRDVPRGQRFCQSAADQSHAACPDAEATHASDGRATAEVTAEQVRTILDVMKL